jgi:hypothetical protein
METTEDLYNFTLKERQLREMATSHNPKSHGGKWPMWIRVEGEHNPAHAHLYFPDERPLRLITKFLITEDIPKTCDDLQTVKGYDAVPKKYGEMIIEWANEIGKRNIPNWVRLQIDWDNVEETFL